MNNLSQAHEQRIRLVLDGFWSKVKAAVPMNEELDRVSVNELLEDQLGKMLQNLTAVGENHFSSSYEDLETVEEDCLEIMYIMGIIENDFPDFWDTPLGQMVEEAYISQFPVQDGDQSGSIRSKFPDKLINYAVQRRFVLIPLCEKKYVIVVSDGRILGISRHINDNYKRKYDLVQHYFELEPIDEGQEIHELVIGYLELFLNRVEDRAASLPEEWGKYTVENLYEEGLGQTVERLLHGADRDLKMEQAVREQVFEQVFYCMRILALSTDELHLLWKLPVSTIFVKLIRWTVGLGADHSDEDIQEKIEKLYQDQMQENIVDQVMVLGGHFRVLITGGKVIGVFEVSRNR